MTHRTVVLIGGGLAAVHAAETLREEGFDGKIYLFSAEAHFPYDRPPLSKGMLTGAVTFDDFSLKLPSWYADREIDMCSARGSTRSTSETGLFDWITEVRLLSISPFWLPAHGHAGQVGCA